MKSVTIRDIRDNRLLIHLIHRKSGVYDLKMDARINQSVVVEIRDEKGHKVIMGKDRR